MSTEALKIMVTAYAKVMNIILWGKPKKINVLPIYSQECMIHSNGVFGTCSRYACYNDCALGKSGAIKTGSHDLIFCVGFQILG